MKKILVIEDNAQDRKIMARYFEKDGLTDIVMATSGEEGIEKTRAEHPDIVVIDTILPRMNGFETCRQIRERADRGRPKIIITTGSIDAVDAVKARKMGADDYCAKTSDFKVLREAIRRLL